MFGKFIFHYRFLFQYWQLISFNGFLSDSFCLICIGRLGLTSLGSHSSPTHICGIIKILQVWNINLYLSDQHVINLILIIFEYFYSEHLIGSNFLVKSADWQTGSNRKYDGVCGEIFVSWYLGYLLLCWNVL